MKEAYAQSIECEEPCEGRLSRMVLCEGETPSLYSTVDQQEAAMEDVSECHQFKALPSENAFPMVLPSSM